MDLKTTSLAIAPQPKFAWSFLAHFGMNMWGDIEDKPCRNGLIKRRLTDEEFALVCTGSRISAHLWPPKPHRPLAHGQERLLASGGDRGARLRGHRVLDW